MSENNICRVCSTASGRREVDGGEEKRCYRNDGGSERGAEKGGGERNERKRFVLINRSEVQMEKAMTVFEDEGGGEREDVPTAARTD